MKELLDEWRVLPPIERTRMLENNADDVLDGHYYRNFSDEEIKDFKELNTANDLEIRALEAEKERVLAPIKARLKELKEAKKHTLTNLSEGREHVAGQYFVFNDDELRKSYHVTPDGHIFYEGPFTSIKEV